MLPFIPVSVGSKHYVLDNLLVSHPQIQCRIHGGLLAEACRLYGYSNYTKYYRYSYTNCVSCDILSTPPPWGGGGLIRD